MDKGTGGGHLQAERRAGILCPPELLRLNCVGVKSFLMEMYVPQLVKIICKSIFLPLESTGGYQKASFCTRKFFADFILQRLCFCSVVLCVHLCTQKFKDQKSFLSLGLFFFFNLCNLFESKI